MMAENEAPKIYKADHGDLNEFHESKQSLEQADSTKEISPAVKVIVSEEISIKPQNNGSISLLQNNTTLAKSEARLGEENKILNSDCSCCKSKSSPFFIPCSKQYSEFDNGDSTEIEDYVGQTKKKPLNIFSLYNYPDEGVLTRIQEYKIKFPRIKKSLLYSSSSDFAEYEKLLLELSPLCAPTTIYFLQDPRENVFRGKFSIYCKSKYRSAFKVKSSSSKGYYAVSPHRGFISPGEEIHLVVEVRPKFKNAGAEWIRESIFKNAALGIFTAVAPLNARDSRDAGRFWEHFEAEHSIFVGGHFIKRFFVVQSNGNIQFPSCTHNIFDSISPSIKNQVNQVQTLDPRDEINNRWVPPSHYVDSVGPFWGHLRLFGLVYAAS
ncbi:unnamed protein product [Allacma fusca]|uniref:MSP domain-containing protein n=1 Tax=Allacma fusca TaxID=39272 RepID=A0A8J2JQB2_9HEXA|nr:unnamed protein product [Allacma fusca]